MIVPDASVVVELLSNGPLADSIESALREEAGPLIVPHLLDVEVMSAFRGLAAGQRIDSRRSHEWMKELSEFPAERYPHQPLITRIWELRHNFTAHDAAYIALAEATDSTLYTCDKKLWKGHYARVLVF
jgi:predicted nucleic acid-binding protein